MTHEKIIKDQRGTVTIIVTLVTFSYGQTDIHGNYYRYDVKVTLKAPRQRNERFCDAATESEIKEAKLELWNKIKPV